MLSLRGLAKSYREGGRERQVFRGVELDVRRGEIVALFGRSGCGKTTLLNLVSGIDQPDAGRIDIDGTEVSALDEHRRTLFRRGNIGFIHQFFNLLPTLTVLENLLLPLELNGRADAVGIARATALLDGVGLASRRESYPDRLSGGEQQRVAVARALVHDPVLVLADEPTGNLDAETGARVLELLVELTRGRGHTLLVASHSNETAAVADHAFSVGATGLQRLPAGATP